MEHLVIYTPQQNGVAERKNRSLKEMETCLIHAKHIPPSLWAKAINCASYLQNRVPHKSVVGATLFKALVIPKSCHHHVIRPLTYMFALNPST